MLKSIKNPHRLAVVLGCLVLGVLIGLNQRQIVDAGTNPTAPTAAIRPQYVYNLANYTGAGVVQDSQAQPQLKATYQSGSATDPWLGGKLNIDWTDYLDLRMGDLQLLTAASFGFGFVAHVNLPSRISADDVLAAMNKFSAGKLTVKSATFPLQRGNFEKIGPHTLRLTMREHNSPSLNWGVFKVLQDIVNDGFSLNHVYVNFNIDVDIATLTADGQPDDTSPNKILTKGRFAPAPDKEQKLSVDFYGADDIREGAASLFGLSPTGYLYANLNPDGSFKVCNRATTTMKTWNSYISPTDNQGTDNTNQDQAEVVDGSAANLPGQVNQRSVTLGYREGTFAAQPADRFNRVVNYFTKENVTNGAQLTHTPLKTTGYNQPTTVVYSGTDSEGTKLSPVALNVTDSHRNNGEVKLTNLTNTVQPSGGIVGTPIRQGTNFTMKGWWRAPDLDHGEIRYRVLALKPGQSLAEAKPVTGREDLLFQTITNSPDYSQKHATSAVLAGLPVGRYVLDTKVVDDAAPDQAQWASTQYLAHPDQNAYPPLIAVVDIPQMTLTSQVTNKATDETGQNITALAGNQIHSTTTITAGTDGTASLEQAVLQLQIPTGTTYQAGSLTVTINGQPQSGMTANFSADTAKIALPQAVKAGDSIKLGLDYQVNDLTDQTLTATPVNLSGTVTVPTDNGTAPAPVSQATNAIAIKIPVAELKLVSGPADFTFGRNVDLPYLPVDLPAKTANLAFTVWDSRAPQMKSNWQITASLSKPFTTATGAVLPTAQLYAEIGNEQHAISAGQETPIYTHEGNARGTIAVQLAKTNQLLLHVDPNAGIQTNVAYQGEIQWQLVDGPQ